MCASVISSKPLADSLCLLDFYDFSTFSRRRCMFFNVLLKVMVSWFIVITVTNLLSIFTLNNSLVFFHYKCLWTLKYLWFAAAFGENLWIITRRATLCYEIKGIVWHVEKCTEALFRPDINIINMCSEWFDHTSGQLWLQVWTTTIRTEDAFEIQCHIQRWSGPHVTTFF